MQTKIPKIVVYIILIGLNLLIGVLMGYTPSDSLNGFFSFLFIGIWVSYTVGVLIRIKKMREYHSTLNNGLIIFGNLFISALYGIWGDFTPILDQRVFPDTFLQINFWIVIFSLPYLIFGTFLLLFSITRYFTIYLGSKAFNARKFTVLMGFVFLGIDLSYILLRHGIYTFDFWDLSHLSGTWNVYIIVHLTIIVFFGILGVITRNRSMSTYNLDQLTSRMNDIDRRINDAETTSAAARQSEQRAYDTELARQRRLERDARRRRDETRRRQPSTARITRPITRTSRPRLTSKASNTSQVKPSAQIISNSWGTELSENELLNMKPKTGNLSKEDFMCIFCFAFPNTSDKSPGVVLCPHCHYPAHYDEFMEWVRNSKLCSRCDGVLPSSFINNPKVIPIKIYLKAYKYFKKQF